MANENLLRLIQHEIDIAKSNDRPKMKQYCLGRIGGLTRAADILKMTDSEIDQIIYLLGPER